LILTEPEGLSQKDLAGKLGISTTQLLLNCIQDIRLTEFRLKWHFKRSRPYHLEPKLQELTKIKSPSFESGHTLWAFTQAFLFSEIIPEKRIGFVANTLPK